MMPQADATYKVAVSKYALDKKIPPGDKFWKEFNASFQNRELRIDDFAGAIHAGHPFTTWHKNNWRHSDNYTLGQHIGLDFDSGDSKSTLATLAADKFIERYGAMVYTTPSHTPETPRARAVFLLDTPIMQPKNYALAASALLWVFGTADRQCKDPVRFFYGSKGCEMVYLANVLPLDTVRKLIQEYQNTGIREKRRQERTFTSSPDQAEVAEALKHIRPWDLDYDEWLSVLMGLHSAFGDGGRQLAEQWADGKEGEVEQKWRSFRANGNTSGAVTVATVFGIAKRFGWQRAA
jgi:hypothetical protein